MKNTKTSTPDIDAHMDVCFCFDGKIVRQMFVAIASCIEATSCGIKFHLIYPDTISGDFESIFSTFKDWAKENHPTDLSRIEYRCYPITASIFNSLPSNKYLPKAAALRLYLHRILKQTQKVLYLDVDVFVTGDLIALYNTDINKVPFAAAEDGFIRIGRPGEPHKGKIGFSGAYFNSGVLLINIPLWAELQIGEQSDILLQRMQDKFSCLDQDALNFVSNSNWLQLDDKWNFMVSEHVHASNWSAVAGKTKLAPSMARGILHFPGGHKPWCRFCISQARFAYTKLAKTVFPDFHFVPYKSPKECLLMWIPRPCHHILHRAFKSFRNTPIKK